MTKINRGTLVLQVGGLWCSFLAAVMDRFYPSIAEDTWRIRTMILSGDVSDDDRIDDGKECDRDYVTGTV